MDIKVVLVKECFPYYGRSQFFQFRIMQCQKSLAIVVGPHAQEKDFEGFFSEQISFLVFGSMILFYIPERVKAQHTDEKNDKTDKTCSCRPPEKHFKAHDQEFVKVFVYQHV